MKKILSLALALALVFTVTAAVFANREAGLFDEAIFENVSATGHQPFEYDVSYFDQIPADAVEPLGAEGVARLIAANNFTPFSALTLEQSDLNNELMFIFDDGSGVILDEHRNEIDPNSLRDRIVYNGATRQFMWNNIPINLADARYFQNPDLLAERTEISAMAAVASDLDSSAVLGTVQQLFPDPQLAQAVANAIGGSTTIDSVVTQQELNWVNSVHGQNVSNLEGVQYLQNLWSFSSRGSADRYISDFTRLTELPIFAFLYLDNNFIHCIEFLLEFNVLVEIDLRNNFIQCVEVFRDINSLHLSFLNLSNNGITCAEPLTYLPWVMWFYIDNNPLESLPDLSGWGGSARLSFRGNRISDISSLSGFMAASWNDFRDQRVTQAVERTQTIRVPNIVAGVGEFPITFQVSHGGRIEGDYIVWEWGSLDDVPATVTYSWNQRIDDAAPWGTIGQFSGTVTVWIGSSFYNSLILGRGTHTVTQSDLIRNNYAGIVVTAWAIVTLDNVNITAAQPFVIDVASDIRINLIGENSLTAINGAGIHVPPGARLTINGPGSLTATAGGGHHAGIGGIAYEGSVTHPITPANGTITINGGTIIAEGSGNGAGIGAGGRDSGSVAASGVVTINDGTVTAFAGNGTGAGIGGGGVSPNSTAAANSSNNNGVHINGGTVIADARGRNGNGGGGAGIGTGNGAGNNGTDYAGIINIGTNADVTAFGAGGGAGIGMGGAPGHVTLSVPRPNNGQITIAGTVRAFGSGNGAGIGGGGSNAGRGGTIAGEIIFNENADVIATSAGNGAGIGGGGGSYGGGGTGLGTRIVVNSGARVVADARGNSEIGLGIGGAGIGGGATTVVGGTWGHSGTFRGITIHRNAVVEAFGAGNGAGIGGGGALNNIGMGGNASLQGINIFGEVTAVGAGRGAGIGGGGSNAGVAGLGGNILISGTGLDASSANGVDVGGGTNNSGVATVNSIIRASSAGNQVRVEGMIPSNSNNHIITWGVCDEGITSAQSVFAHDDGRFELEHPTPSASGAILTMHILAQGLNGYIFEVDVVVEGKNSIIQQFDVRIGDYVSIPISARRISSDIEYFVIFDSENFELVNAREQSVNPVLSRGIVDETNLYITEITSNSISFRSTVNAEAGVINTVRLRARRTGIFDIAIYTAVAPTGAIFENIYDIARSNMEYIAHKTLTSTLGEPIGMQGFEGEHAIVYDGEIIEVYVQFRTPPYVALRLMHERGIPANVGLSRFFPDERALSNTSFEEQALAAHVAFQQQLTELPMPRGGATELEIIHEHHRLFNGVLIRACANTVERISRLPEVFSVFPRMTIDIEYPAYISTEDISATNFQFGNAQLVNDSFFVNPDLMIETRNFFDLEYINREMQINGLTGVTGAGVRVAVLDTGIQHDHPEFVRFQDETGRIRGWHRGDNGLLPIRSRDLRFRSHGTSVSGAVIGIAPNVELWHYQLWPASASGNSGIIAGVENAHADGVQVMNISAGFNSEGHNNPFHPANHIINLAVLDGIVVVAISHNRGGALGQNQFSVITPGTASLAITVGAGRSGGLLDPNGINDWMQGYSGRGPVGETYHIKPDIIAPTVVRTTSIDEHHNSTYTPNDNVIDANGTSHAAPIIAGVAALLIEAHPGIEPWEVKARIMNTARPMTGTTYGRVDNNVFISGAGFVRPYQALRADTIVTVEHLVPFCGNRFAPFVQETMSSLSFGSVDPYDNTMSMRIENRSNVTRTYTLDRTFTDFPGTNNNAEIAFSKPSIIVPAGEVEYVDVALTFGDNAAFGFYQGHIYVHIQGENDHVARLPFAANFTDTVRPVAITTAPNMIFNRALLSHTLGEIILSATGASPEDGSNFFVVINPLDNETNESVGIEPYHRRISINANQTAGVTAEIWWLNNIFSNRSIEILVYRGNVAKHLVSRQIIHPVVF